MRTRGERGKSKIERQRARTRGTFSPRVPKLGSAVEKVEFSRLISKKLTNVDFSRLNSTFFKKFDLSLKSNFLKLKSNF
jgi:hypothetical protein